MSANADQQDAWRRLAAAGHDLRQPLHALGLYLALLARKEADSELGPRLIAALDEVRDAFDLALDFAKLQAGAWRPRLRDFEVGDAFAAVRERLASQAAIRGVELRFVGGGLRARGDAELLRRALSELAGRVVRAARGGRVLIGARRRGGDLRIEIRDSGPTQAGPSDELSHALAIGLAQLAGGRCEVDRGGASVVLPLA
jgi:signal transduction histidine kinase